MKNIISLRKLLCLLLAVLMAASLLTACGGQKDPVKDDGQQAGQEGGEASGEAVNLVIWCQATNQAEYLQWAKEAFESQYENIELTIKPQATTVLGDTLDVTLASDGAPDIVATWGGSVAGRLYKGNLILELSDVITPEVEANIVDAAAPNKMDGDGKYVGLPIGGFVSPVIYYNKTAFDALGIAEPTTYAELKAACDAIRADGKQTIIAGFNTWHLPHFMQAIHARTMTPENFNKLIGLPTDVNPYTLPGFQEGFDLLKQYNDDGILADNITGYDANMAQMEFVAQNALMLTAPSLDLLTLVDACDFELGTFLLPAGEVDGPLASGVYSDVFAINANSKNIEAAKTFFRFLLTDEAQAKQVEYEMMPILKGVDNSGANPIIARVLAEVSETGMSGFYQSFSVSGVDMQLLTAGSSLLTGEIDSAAAAKIVADYYQANIIDKQ